jgi:hypothetical protein
MEMNIVINKMSCLMVKNLNLQSCGEEFKISQLQPMQMS